jgi:hypothetical protein
LKPGNGLDRRVPIGGRAFEVLEILVQSGGERVTKDALVNSSGPAPFHGKPTPGSRWSNPQGARSVPGLLRTESRRGYRLLGDWTIRRRDPARPPIDLRQLRATVTTLTMFHARAGNFKTALHYAKLGQAPAATFAGCSRYRLSPFNANKLFSIVRNIPANKWRSRRSCLELVNLLRLRVSTGTMKH